MRAGRTLPMTITASGNRPQPLSVNKSSPQYDGSGYQLLAWWPLWITSATANAVDLVSGLVGTPSNIKIYNDPVMGPVFQGDGTTRKYTVPYPKILDFGGVHGSDPSFPFSVSAWVRTTITSGQLTNNNDPPNMYVYTFDNPNPAYPGHAIDLARNFQDEGGNSPIVFEFAVDSGSAQVSDFGNKKLNDGNWHRIVGVYPCPPGANQNTGNIVGYLYVDGVLDIKSNNTPQAYDYFGIGSPGPSQPLYIGTDDDGKTSCWNGEFFDLMIWSGVLPASLIGGDMKSNPWGLYN